MSDSFRGEKYCEAIPTIFSKFESVLKVGGSVGRNLLFWWGGRGLGGVGLWGKIDYQIIVYVFVITLCRSHHNGSQ